LKTTIKVDPSGQFRDNFREKLARVKDLRIPLELIRESWFKGNRSIFALSGPGRYVDLSASYKRQKRRQVGFVYPILRKSGLLEAALTEPGNTNSISQLIGKKSLDLGVTESIRYFGYVHFGTRKMKARPYILLGAEQVSPPDLNRRVEAWQKLIQDYVIGVTGATDGKV
jgi:hypothetical protein